MFSIFRNPLIASCLIAFGILLIYGGHKNAAEFTAMQDHGLTADAEITELKWEEKKRNHDDCCYNAYVSFTTEDSREIRKNISIPTEFGRALRNQTVESIMTIRYLPESPTTFRDVNQMDSSEAQGSVGGYMLLTGFIMLALHFWLGGKKSETHSSQRGRTR